MGRLLYGAQEREIEIEDRSLAHLKLVIIAKLRRGESFTFSLQTQPDAVGDATLWLHPSIPVQFIFDGEEPRQLNRAWLEALNGTASRGDLRLLTESSATRL